MSELAIRVASLGKTYELGERSQHEFATLRDSLSGAAGAPLRWAKAAFGRRGAGETRATARARSQSVHHALNDISFEVRPGEVVGIIGRNGAGKSTLLKILSRITEPSRGRVEIYGRVASLLEVGTGFHPELTGRENIYLNGAILGMERVEIDRKFDEIVAFSEIEKFLDTPVKFYSSGMYVRLAFAVAAHLEPEVLVVDEVLAVGDRRFQKKCLNKMQDVGQEGRTVLFVSHSMSSITRMCPRAILLDEGRVLKDGPSSEVVGIYMNSEHGMQARREWANPAKAPTGEFARLCAVSVRDAGGAIAESIDIRQPVQIEMEYEVLKPGAILLPHFHFHREEQLVFTSIDQDPEWRQRARPVGSYTSSVTIPGNFLSEGTMFVEAALITLDPVRVQFGERDAVAFHVIDSMDGDTARGDWGGNMGGVVRPLLPWMTEYRPSG